VKQETSSHPNAHPPSIQTYLQSANDKQAQGNKRTIRGKQGRGAALWTYNAPVLVSEHQDG
jgi:hypothetical protein